MEVPECVNILDLKTLVWSTGPSVTQARDDFASAFDKHNGRLYIFGGFNKGQKMNDLIYYDLTKQMEVPVEVGTERP